MLGWVQARPGVGEGIACAHPKDFSDDGRFI